MDKPERGAANPPRSHPRQAGTGTYLSPQLEPNRPNPRFLRGRLLLARDGGIASSPRNPGPPSRVKSLGTVHQAQDGPLQNRSVLGSLREKATWIGSSRRPLLLGWQVMLQNLLDYYCCGCVSSLRLSTWPPCVARSCAARKLPSMSLPSCLRV